MTSISMFVVETSEARASSRRSSKNARESFDIVSNKGLADFFLRIGMTGKSENEVCTEPTKPQKSEHWQVEKVSIV